VASVLSVAALDFLFVPPVLTFARLPTSLPVHVPVMLVVGLVTSSHGGAHPDASGRPRASATADRGALRHEPGAASTRGWTALDDRGATHQRGFRSQVVVLLPAPAGPSSPRAADSSRWTRTSSRREVGARAPSAAGSATATLARRRGALSAAAGAARTRGRPRYRTADRHALDAPTAPPARDLSNQTALAIERASSRRGARGPGADRDRAPAHSLLARSRTTCGRRWPRSRSLHHDPGKRIPAGCADAARIARVGARGGRSAESSRPDLPR